MYQLPHLSLAIRGSSHSVATCRTNSASWRMERRRLWVDKADRRIVANVLETFWEAVGKISWVEEVGKLGSSPVLAFSVIIALPSACWDCEGGRCARSRHVDGQC